MASFHTKTFKKFDDYATPKEAWEAVETFIPKDKTLWEAFYCDGESGNHLRDLGFKTIHENIDFYDHDLGDMVVSNPPFSDCKNVLKRLAELDKPFMLIMPSSKINTSYVRENFMNKGLQIIIPRKRIQFIKVVDGQMPKDFKSHCNFDCFYYCYRMNLDRDIVWLD
jgi:hypothetical protein